MSRIVCNDDEYIAGLFIFAFTFMPNLEDWIYRPLLALSIIFLFVGSDMYYSPDNHPTNKGESK